MFFSPTQMDYFLGGSLSEDNWGLGALSPFGDALNAFNDVMSAKDTGYIQDVLNDNTNVDSDMVLPDLDNLSGVVDSNSIADINWAKELESLYGKMDQWIKAEMAYNDEAQDRSMAFNAEQAELERVYNSVEAVKNRDWQEYMSNTSYQRAVEDMRKAGLNPILLSARASGASTPAGSMATATSARSAGNASITGLANYLPNMLKALGSMVNSTASMVDAVIPL